MWSTLRVDYASETSVEGEDLGGDLFLFRNSAGIQGYRAITYPLFDQKEGGVTFYGARGAAVSRVRYYLSGWHHAMIGVYEPKTVVANDTPNEWFERERTPLELTVRRMMEKPRHVLTRYRVEVSLAPAAFAFSDNIDHVGLLISL